MAEYWTLFLTVERFSLDNSAIEREWVAQFVFG